MDQSYEHELMQQKPDSKPAFLQRWKDLLFLHYPVLKEEIRRTVPEELELDTFPDANGRESAWVGIVAFQMERVRPFRFPAIKKLSNFCETNVRTYVRHDGKSPGVWFLSLDASQPLAAKIAKARYGLLYQYSKMSVERTMESCTYQSERIGGNLSNAIESNIKASFGPAIGNAKPGSLEHFLVERYVGYSELRGELHRFQVWHRPYPLRGAILDEAHESLTAAVHLPRYSFQSVLFSDGVDVEVYSPEAIS